MMNWMIINLIFSSRSVAGQPCDLIFYGLFFVPQNIGYKMEGSVLDGIGREIRLKYLLDCGRLPFFFWLQWLFTLTWLFKSDLKHRILGLYFQQLQFLHVFCLQIWKQNIMHCFLNSSSITRSKTIWDAFFIESHA